MKSRKNTGMLRGKGYYIALILCAAAIGISSYVYYRSIEDQPQLQGPGTNESSGPVTDDVEAVAPDPQPVQPGDTQPSTPGKPGSSKVSRPLSGEVIHGYSMDCLSYDPTTRDWRVHDGIDIAATVGAQVLAAADGTVYTVYEDEAMGTTVVIRHEGGYVTTYAGLDSKLSVEAGDAVESGQVIGTVGEAALQESALGEHLHFSVSCNDVSVDPESFLKGE